MKVWIDKPTEPTRLILAWQAPDGQEDRLRWAVGHIDYQAGATFRYFSESELLAYNLERPLEKLLSAGFSGYPAFSFSPGQSFTADVLETFLRRLPPRRREDFAQYQEYFSIRPRSDISGPMLLALTEARLPSDGFSLVDPLSPEVEVCDAAFEIAGFRYEAEARALEVGARLSLRPAPDNLHDRNAVEVFWNDLRIGFVNRLQAPTIAHWLASRDVVVEVLRRNGKASAPRAYAKISIRPKAQHLAA